MRTHVLDLILPLLLIAAMAGADSIIVDGQLYEDVYVQEGGSLYYIGIPETGEILHASKASVRPEEVVLDADSDRRKALKERWEASNRASKVDLVTPVPRAPSTASGERDAAPEPRTASSDGAGVRTITGSATPPARNTRPAASGLPSGYVPYINLKNVPLSDALKSVLRTQGLDYIVKGNIVWVSSPQRIRHEPLETPETRHYALKNIGSETLPKIVVRTGGIVGAPGGGGFGGGSFGGGFGGGGFGGGGNIGSVGFGGLGGGGLGGGGLGGGGFGGGLGGGGLGGGGFGGDVTWQFSNISDLFFNIDDRLVGETPAIIGLGVISYPPPGQRGTALPGGAVGGLGGLGGLAGAGSSLAIPYP